jgi:hypothetical protein
LQKLWIFLAYYFSDITESKEPDYDKDEDQLEEKQEVKNKPGFSILLQTVYTETVIFFHNNEQYIRHM